MTLHSCPLCSVMDPHIPDPNRAVFVRGPTLVHGRRSKLVFCVRTLGCSHGPTHDKSYPDEATPSAEWNRWAEGAAQERADRLGYGYELKATFFSGLGMACLLPLGNA